MIVAVHFCEKDGWLAIKNLEWVIHLDEKVPFNALLSYDHRTSPATVAKVKELATAYFNEVKELKYGAPSVTSWPQAPNKAFQETARFIRMEYDDCWFWWEADATPLRKDWLYIIDREYREKALPDNKVFMGAVVEGIIPGNHMNGVGVYPNDVGQYSRNAMLALNAPWDVVMAKDIRRWIYPANHLFQHCWALDAQGHCCNDSSGAIPTFIDWNDVAKGPHYVKFTAVIFHRCKDGSIIDHWKTKAIEENQQFSQLTAQAVQVVELPKAPKAKERRPQKADPDGMRIMIVTYWKDFTWLKYCLLALTKYAHGFTGITVVIPGRDTEAYIKEVGLMDGIKFRPFDEIEGKGMLHHMERIANADYYCKDSGYVLHFDADTIAQEPITPDDYIVDGKPVYVVRSYESLKENGVISDCYQWKAVAEQNIGEPIEMFTMCRHPNGFPVDFYPEFRKHIERVHKTDFKGYLMSCRNKFPQTFAEFPAMGGFAWAHMHDRFYWMDVKKDGAPKDKTKSYWSHGGLDQKMAGGVTARDEIERVLAK